jgi:hypothetical protein
MFEDRSGQITALTYVGNFRIVLQCILFQQDDVGEMVIDRDFIGLVAMFYVQALL